MSTFKNWCAEAVKKVPGTFLLLLLVGGAAWAQAEAETTVAVTAFGKKYLLPSTRVEGLTFVQVDWRLREIAQKYGATMDWDAASATLTVRRGNTATAWKQGDKRVVGRDANGWDVKADLTVAADGRPFMPLMALSSLLPCKVVPGQEPQTFDVDPLIGDIRLVPDRSEHALHIEASAPVTMQTMVLKNPDRFVVDITNACLDLDKFGTTRAIEDPDLGQIRFGQFSYQPSVVRVVIPLQGDLEVEPLPQSTAQHLVMALRKGDVRVLGQNFTDQRITGVRFAKGSAGATVVLQMSGPMEYEWHRLRPPDNRVFVDLPQAILMGHKRTFEVNDGYVNDITVSQFQVKPRPIVRVVLSLAKVAALDVHPEGRGKSELAISVGHQEAALNDETLRGYGVTGAPGRGATVVIDPGHGGSDSGAINRASGLMEKTVTLDIALRLTAMMKKEGWNVFLTRTRDQDVSYAGSSANEELAARVKVANDVRADLFVSIHCNASADTKAHGSSAHWYKPADWPLAKAILGYVVQLCGGTSKGVQQNRFYVLRHSKMPSVLVETAFITNDKEGELLSRPDYRETQARAIFEGMKTYVATHGSRRASMRK